AGHDRSAPPTINRFPPPDAVFPRGDRRAAAKPSAREPKRRPSFPCSRPASTPVATDEEEPMTTVIPSCRPALPAALAALLAAATLGAQGVVSPADRALLEGDASSSYPLGRANGRFQQIHADLGASTRPIGQHAYRRDAINQRGDVLAFTTELEVTLSVAASAPDAAVRDFATNHGPNPVTVLPRTRMSFPTTARPAQDPAATFEHVIPYATPFTLPGGAPLCVDVVVFGNTTSRGNDVNFIAELDAQTFPANGSVVQPGYAYGSGCAAPGASRTHDAGFESVRA